MRKRGKGRLAVSFLNHGIRENEEKHSCLNYIEAKRFVLYFLRYTEKLNA